jgi:hypothetical protein
VLSDRPSAVEPRHGLAGLPLQFDFVRPPCLERKPVRLQAELADDRQRHDRVAEQALRRAGTFQIFLSASTAAEQARIVARVEELRVLCAELRARLTARQTCQTRFANAVVEQAASTVPSAAHTDDLTAAA